MNPDIKRRWINALRSGDFQQGKAALRTRDDRYCCLGVLCALAVVDGVIDSPVLSDNGNELDSYVYGDFYDRSSGFLPEKVAVWAGVSVGGTLNTYVSKKGFAGGSLSPLNDEGAPFSFIADIIEEHL